MTIVQFFRVVELRTKLVSVATLACAFAYALSGAFPVDWGAAPLLVLATLAVDMGTTAFNSFFDYWRGVDNRHSNREVEKVLVHEGLPPLAALLVALALFAIAAVLGVFIAIRSGAWVVAAGFASLVAGFAYSGGPRPISTTPFGELVAGGFLGWGLFAIAAGVLGARDVASLSLAGLPLLPSVAAILSANNACDFDNDVAGGRKTLAILVGRRRAAWPFYAGVAASWLSMLGLAAFGALPVASLACVVPGAAAAFAIAAKARARGFEHDRKGPQMQAALRLHLLAAACLALSFLARLALPNA